MKTAEEMIAALGLVPLEDEGGWYRAMWRSADDATASYIYYFLKRGERSRWHKLHTSNEVWTWCAGGSLEMTLGGTGERPVTESKTIFGPRPGTDSGYVSVAPAGHWQTTRVVDGNWALVTCVVSPAFQPEDCFLPHPPIETDLTGA